MKSNSDNKVILGLSGGVDSAAAALLLKEKGYQVIGLYFSTTGDYEDELSGAQRTAEELGIPLIHRALEKEFQEKIIRPFCQEYSVGRTPNPCTLCNPTIKFPVLLEEAEKQGAAYLATGHYANVVYSQKWNQWAIERGHNHRKDQSYMLYGLDSVVIKRLLLPLGDWEDKEAVRRLAETHQLANARKKDSQEICFVDRDYPGFLKKQGYDFIPGDFVDQRGQVLGKHKGIAHYTIGQRKGLGLSLGKPVFVTAIDSVQNRVIVGGAQDLMKKQVVVENPHFILPRDQLQGVRLEAKIRYAGEPEPGTITTMEDDTVTFIFEEDQRAVTPGQSIVFYDGELVLGGGTIQCHG